jgi:glycerol uptake facilitator-like aquaporin
MDRALARSLVAELIGTFALVFAGAGAYQFVRGEQNALIPSNEEA